MKTKFVSLALFSITSVAGATAAFARQGSAPSDYHKDQSGPAAKQVAPFGYATTGPADRVVNLDQIKSLNVTRLETVQINAGGKSVTWTFDTLSTRSFALEKVVPWAEGITVYMQENPMYKGG
ncbi:glucose dehydrogenase [Janthinobacterium sp. CG_23.3]|uniref:CzcE family metal-binding protein n=1 Tax=Janthinobacterium sp. CG_23.3 TaxID=3349634 RepID=UPI0038D45740